MITPNLDTFLVALYTIVDDLYRSHYPSTGPKTGPRPVMSDSEIITLTLCCQWLKWPERKLLRYVKDHWRSYFPRLLSQPEYNRRLNALANRMAHLVPEIRSGMSGQYASYEILDCVPVPLMKRCRGSRTKLFAPNIANIGKGGSDRDWYYGVKLALLVRPQGSISGFMVAPARTSDRWPAEYLFCHRNDPGAEPATVEDLPPSHGKKRVGPGGAIWPTEGIGNGNSRLCLADRGFKGRWCEQHWETDYSTKLVTPDSYDGEHADKLRRMHSTSRQVIEDVNEHLTGDLGLNSIVARGVRGLLARIAAKLIAFNLGVKLNHLLGRCTFAIGTLFNL